MIRIALLASGSGTNVQAILDAHAQGKIQGEIVGVIVNVPGAAVIQRAHAAGVRCVVIPHRDYGSRAEFEQAMAQVLTQWQIDLIVLAGFMRILSAEFVQRFSGQMINIHPSLLPAYKGLHTHDRVLATGDRLHGCSIHFVTPDLDAGAVIAQSVLTVAPHESSQQLAARVNVLELQLYPRIVSWISAGRIVFLGNKPYLDGKELLTPVRFWNHG